MAHLDTRPLAVETPEKQRSWLQRNRKDLRIALITGIIFFLILGFVTAWLIQPVPYIALGPGDTEPVQDLTIVPAKEYFPHKGRVYFTTVSESTGRIKRFQYYWVKWVDKDYELIKDQPLTGAFYAPCSNPDSLEADQMTISQRKALSVALRRVGRPSTVSAVGAQIINIVPKSPADGRFSVCDSIVSVDGKKILEPEDVQKAVRSHAPGDVIRFVVNSGVSNEKKTVTVKTRRGEDGKAQVGIAMEPYSLQVKSKSKVRFRKTEIGGPSAGLPFTIGLIDDLTAGDLTGGREIAATGEVNLKGEVLEIGGIREKVISVHRAGINYFLVPRGNYKEALKAAPKGMTIIKVGTVEDALDAIKKLGGDVRLPAAPDLSKL